MTLFLVHSLWQCSGLEVSCESFKDSMPFAQAPVVFFQRPGAELGPECLASSKLWSKLLFSHPAVPFGLRALRGSYVKALGVSARWPHPRVALPYMRRCSRTPLWDLAFFSLQVLGFQFQASIPRAFSLQHFFGTCARGTRVSVGSTLRRLGAL